MSLHMYRELRAPRKMASFLMNECFRGLKFK